MTRGYTENMEVVGNKVSLCEADSLGLGKRNPFSRGGLRSMRALWSLDEAKMGAPPVKRGALVRKSLLELRTPYLHLSAPGDVQEVRCNSQGWGGLVHGGEGLGKGRAPGAGGVNV